jgi:hypothetical protein
LFQTSSKRCIFLRMRFFFWKSCRENQHKFLSPINFFRLSCRLWNNVEKKDRAIQATDDNIICAE